MKRKVVPPSASQQPQLFSSRSSYFPLFYNPPWFERQNITISNWCLIKLGSWWTKTIFYKFRALLHTFQKKRNDQEPRTRLNISTSPKLNIFRVKLFQICPLFFQSRDCKPSHNCSSGAGNMSLLKISGTGTLVQHKYHGMCQLCSPPIHLVQNWTSCCTKWHIPSQFITHTLDAAVPDVISGYW